MNSSWMPAWALPTVRDAALVVAGCAVVALCFNALRPAGLPLVAEKPYEILVPCPVVSGEITPIAVDDARLAEARTLLLDARPAADFAAWHQPNARSLAFDWLEPVSEAQVKQVAASGALLVAIYGDGAEPDCGAELGKELAARGIRNVHVVSGGAAALRARSER